VRARLINMIDVIAPLATRTPGGHWPENLKVQEKKTPAAAW
jgi:hypothetical protein